MNEFEDRRKKEDWHLDKKVPISLLAMIIVQTMVLSFWLGDLAARVKALEQAQKASNNLVERVIVIEAHLKHISATITSIGDKTDQWFKIQLELMNTMHQNVHHSNGNNKP